MTPRQAEIMGLFDSGYTGAEIATRLGITRERVRQIVTGQGRNLRAARSERAKRRQQFLKFKATHILCELCEMEFTRTTNRSLCDDCTEKYKRGVSGTHWSTFKMIGKKFPEFIFAIQRISKNGGIQ